MALPSSGQLTLAQIRDEFGAGTTSNVSLRTLSAAAGLSVPDGFNEFYGLSAWSGPQIAPERASWISSGSGTAASPYVIDAKSRLTNIVGPYYEEFFGTDVYRVNFPQYPNAGFYGVIPFIPQDNGVTYRMKVRYTSLATPDSTHWPLEYFVFNGDGISQFDNYYFTNSDIGSIINYINAGSLDQNFTTVNDGSVVVPIYHGVNIVHWKIPTFTSYTISIWFELV